METDVPVRYALIYFPQNGNKNCNLLYFTSLVLIELKRRDGGTPIHLACRLGALEILKCLYEHEPAAFQRTLVDKEDMTPLHRYFTVKYLSRSLCIFHFCLSYP